ncbi:hypothetical protein Salat_1591000 [Sesamum alatum]|uniref:Uncharacterized protein n=1 Tax=Sesamum alatum TaxID=300844 RepID=A0AAE1Y676_9LAMI|nr:hypothetical protein Salat_1591000 [Sesamum alatum]
MIENDGSPTPRTNAEIVTPAFKINTCNFDVDMDTCDVTAVNLHNVSVIHEPADAEHNANELHDITHEEYEAVIDVNNTGIDVNGVSNVDIDKMHLLSYCAADVVDNCNNVCELRDENVVGHCEGVAMEAPLQCAVFVPCPPNSVGVPSKEQVETTIPLNNREEGNLIRTEFSPKSVILMRLQMNVHQIIVLKLKWMKEKKMSLLHSRPLFR